MQPNNVVVITVEMELSGQELLNYISEFVQVEYVQVERVSGGGVDGDMDMDAAASLRHLRLTNVGQQTVIGGGWSVYFNHAGDVMDEALNDSEDVVMRNVDGWLFTLMLRLGLRLRPLSNITVPTPVQLPSRSYAFPRWYHVRYFVRGSGCEVL